MQAKASDLDASIKAMETAFRMQTEAPDVVDVSKESKATLDMYGTGSTALGCLMAARLVNPRATSEGPAGGLTVAESLQAFKDALRGEKIEVRGAEWYPLQAPKP